MSKEDWDFDPFCPFFQGESLQGEKCSHECALAVRLNNKSNVACAFAVLAARDTDYSVNVVFGPRWGK